MKLSIDKWQDFKLKDLFKIVYGVNLEYSNCEETTKDDPEAIPFVSRTETNNGVSGYVKPIAGIEPQKAGLITVAAGGSVLSTFVQPQQFYSGRDLYLLIPRYEMSLSIKLFIVTLITTNKYKYNYGRQANKTLPDIVIKLPVNESCNPDWLSIEKFMGGVAHKAYYHFQQILSQAFGDE